MAKTKRQERLAEQRGRLLDGPVPVRPSPGEVSSYKRGDGCSVCGKKKKSLFSNDERTAVFCTRRCADQVGSRITDFRHYHAWHDALPSAVVKRKEYFKRVLGAGGAAIMRAGGEEAEKIAKVRENHRQLNAMRRGKLARAIELILKPTSIDIDAPLSQHDVLLHATDVVEIAKQTAFELYQAGVFNVFVGVQSAASWGHGAWGEALTLINRNNDWRELLPRLAIVGGFVVNSSTLKQNTSEVEWQVQDLLQNNNDDRQLVEELGATLLWCEESHNNKRTYGGSYALPGEVSFVTVSFFVAEDADTADTARRVLNQVRLPTSVQRMERAHTAVERWNTFMLLPAETIRKIIAALREHSSSGNESSRAAELEKWLEVRDNDDSKPSHSNSSLDMSDSDFDISSDEEPDGSSSDDDDPNRAPSPPPYSGEE